MKTAGCSSWGSQQQIDLTLREAGQARRSGKSRDDFMGLRVDC